MKNITKATPLVNERQRELLRDSTPYVYQIEDEHEMRSYCYFPDLDEGPELRPVMLFLHGGLWDVSMILQFAPHAIHFAKRGMISVLAEYRVSSTHGASPEDAFEDAQMAVLWIKHNYRELGADPNRIVVVGAASGAHMALSLAMRKDLIEIDGLSPHPFAVIGLSALVDTTKKGIANAQFADPPKAAKNSPSKNVRRKLVPTMLVHGKSDTIIPWKQVAKFATSMKRKKNTCHFIDFEACNHSFFNFNVNAEHFATVLNSMDAFLVELGCIDPIDYEEI